MCDGRAAVDTHSSPRSGGEVRKHLNQHQRDVLEHDRCNSASTINPVRVVKTDE